MLRDDVWHCKLKAQSRWTKWQQSLPQILNALLFKLIIFKRSPLLLHLHYDLNHQSIYLVHSVQKGLYVIDWFLIAICSSSSEVKWQFKWCFLFTNVSNWSIFNIYVIIFLVSGWCSQTHQIILGSQKQTIVKWEFISNEKPLCTQS